MREFIDEEHQIEDQYFKIMDRYSGKNAQSIIPRLNKFIENDPYYFDSYNSLVDLYYSKGEIEKANKIINQASKKALERILDRKGNWPDRLEWGWLENRHIIRAIVNQAILYWKTEETEKALNLFRNLFRSNPNDNVGARYYILGIRLNISFTDFELRFNKNGFYDYDIVKWFDENYKRFSDEFECWDKQMNDYGAQLQDCDVNEIADDDTDMKFFTFENIFDKLEVSDEFRKIADIINAKKQQSEMALSSQSENLYKSRIFQLKITIEDIKPPIWRRILISNQTNFYELHLTIQELFNWGNYHLHEYNIVCPQLFY
jgi:tetratricopeptide (TPR) repeat protein